jgi:hypothetical protein
MNKSRARGEDVEERKVMRGRGPKPAQAILPSLNASLNERQKDQ